MIVKNIATDTRYFTFGERRYGKGQKGITLANNATATLSDGDAGILTSVRNYIAQGLLQLVEGPSDLTLLTSVNQPAVGYIAATGAVSDADVVTVAGLAFKWANDPGTGVLGTYYASLSARWAGDGAAAATALATLKTALNANTVTTGIAAETVVVSGASTILPLRATAGNITTTGLTLVKTTGVNLVVSGATLAAGVQGTARKTAVIRHVVTAADATLAAILLPVDMATISRALVNVTATAGATKAWGGTTVLNGSTVVLTNNGTVDWVETDVINVFVQE